VEGKGEKERDAVERERMRCPQNEKDAFPWAPKRRKKEYRNSTAQKKKTCFSSLGQKRKRAKRGNHSVHASRKDEEALPSEIEGKKKSAHLVKLPSRWCKESENTKRRTLLSSATKENGRGFRGGGGKEK